MAGVNYFESRKGGGGDGDGDGGDVDDGDDGVDGDDGDDDDDGSHQAPEALWGKAILHPQKPFDGQILIKTLNGTICHVI